MAELWDRGQTKGGRALCLLSSSAEPSLLRMLIICQPFTCARVVSGRKVDCRGENNGGGFANETDPKRRRLRESPASPQESRIKDLLKNSPFHVSKFMTNTRIRTMFSVF